MSTSPEALAKIELDYAAGGYNHVPAIGALLDVIHEFQWKSVHDGFPPLVNGVPMRVDIRAVSPLEPGKAQVTARYVLAVVIGINPPKIKLANGDEHTFPGDGEVWWRPS